MDCIQIGSSGAAGPTFALTLTFNSVAGLTKLYGEITGPLWLSYKLFGVLVQTEQFTTSAPTFPPIRDIFRLRGSFHDVKDYFRSTFPRLEVYLCTTGVVLGCATVPLHSLLGNDRRPGPPTVVPDVTDAEATGGFLVHPLNPPALAAAFTDGKLAGVDALVNGVVSISLEQAREVLRRPRDEPAVDYAAIVREKDQAAESLQAQAAQAAQLSALQDEVARERRAREEAAATHAAALREKDSVIESLRVQAAQLGGVQDELARERRARDAAAADHAAALREKDRIIDNLQAQAAQVGSLQESGARERRAREETAATHAAALREKDRVIESLQAQLNGMQDELARERRKVEDAAARAVSLKEDLARERRAREETAAEHVAALREKERNVEIAVAQAKAMQDKHGQQLVAAQQNYATLELRLRKMLTEAERRDAASKLAAMEREQALALRRGELEVLEKRLRDEAAVALKLEKAKLREASAELMQRVAAAEGDKAALVCWGRDAYLLG